MLALLDDSPDRLSAMLEAAAGWRPEVGVRAFDNAPEMIEWLGGHLRDCTLISLDHDLGPSREIGGERRDPGTGRDVADFLARQAPACPVVVHTSNNLARVGMEFALKDSGWKVLHAYPGPDLSWVATSWLATVREALGQRAGN